MYESAKFAWAYLLTYGKLTRGKWDYYGGCWDDLDNDWGSIQRGETVFEKIKAQVLSIGIDWGKTEVPSVTDESSFEGTDSDSGRCLATLGKLVLKNGETFLIGSSDDDAAHLAETAREMIQGKSEIMELAGKL